MLTFTVHLLLKGLASNRLHVGDLDPCLDLMIEVSYLKLVFFSSIGCERSVCFGDIAAGLSLQLQVS